MEAEDWEAVAMGVAMVAPLLAPRHLAHLAAPARTATAATAATATASCKLFTVR